MMIRNKQLMGNEQVIGSGLLKTVLMNGSEDGGEELVILESKRRRNDRENSDFMVTGLERSALKDISESSKNGVGAGSGDQARPGQ